LLPGKFKVNGIRTHSITGDKLQLGQRRHQGAGSANFTAGGNGANIATNLIKQGLFILCRPIFMHLIAGIKSGPIPFRIGAHKQYFRCALHVVPL